MLLEHIINELKTTKASSFEIALLNSLKANAESEISFLKNNKHIGSVQIRDKQMAENLKWLLKNKFPNEKIIVWAHNMHILKHSELIKDPGLNFTNMGSHFTSDRKLYEQTYVLGFNSRTGTAGRITNGNKKFSVKLPVENSFETWIPETIPYAFVDFKRFRIKNPLEKAPFYMKSLWQSETNAVWTEHFDGVFYIRDMYPCILVSK